MTDRSRFARTPRLRPALRAWLAAALVAIAVPARADDAALEWNPLANNAGARWTYGHKATMQGGFTLRPNAFTDAQGVQH